MTNNSDESRECPYCKEEIKSGAIKCKHCSSRIAPATPDHGGTCPYCKESINEEAIKCKYCKTNLNQISKVGYGCSESALEFGRNQISTADSALQEIPSEVSSQLGELQSNFLQSNVICFRVCVERSELFPEICNRWIRRCVILPPVGPPIWFDLP